MSFDYRKSKNRKPKIHVIIIICALTCFACGTIAWKYGTQTRILTLTEYETFVVSQYSSDGTLEDLPQCREAINEVTEYIDENKSKLWVKSYSSNGTSLEVVFHGGIVHLFTPVVYGYDG